MKHVILNIEKEYECDVVVCGGGVSGFAAVVSAALTGYVFGGRKINTAANRPF